MAQLKYLWLAGELRRGIRDGVWPPGARLPAESELAAAHRLSVNTVRRALEELAGEGSMERRQGAGTFVRALPAGRRGGRRRIAVVLPERHSYFPPLVEGIEAAAARARVDLRIRTTGYGPPGWGRLERVLADVADADGLVLAHPGPGPFAAPEQSHRLRALPMPHVLLERAPIDVGDPSEHVSTDHGGGAYLALEHLAALGHREVALVVRVGSAPSEGIAKGFDQAVAALGLKAAERFRWVQDYNAKCDGRSMLRPVAAEVLGVIRASGATAVVCFGEQEATLLLAEAQRVGVRIPADLAMVSCEDRQMPEGGLALTSVAPEKFRLGRLAVETLLRRLDEPDAELRRIWLRPRLVVRASSLARRDGSAGPS
ncbi:hypothetical protein BIV57_08415 [Mangrovactinospora gilvigrisea]|uniref:HTH gntR-type domain-containing protein n=1 Tax=Mangrovactinospora gilvigrisea TaxID=1428644 RepID=A0A1J7BGZ0_9ACTN|nr:GntR family transcriptional regulator [Mangrovactinospora gilvigrisea]OIV37951.1 hypothetical protein BIV57_08415 [Mangrovactinospora gilvigrisea]